MSRTLLAFMALLVSPASAEEISLKRIRAAHMPGARNIRELEPRTQGDNREFGPLMHTIYRTMQGGRGGDLWGRPDAGPGFPVRGVDIAALNATYDILVGQYDRPTEVPPGNVSLIFFARRSGGNCYLEKVTREENIISLTYRFHATRTAIVTAHFALIPLGTLEPGKYEVRNVQLPMAHPPTKEGVVYTPPIEGERLKRMVSEPYSFEVK